MLVRTAFSMWKELEYLFYYNYNHLIYIIIVINVYYYYKINYTDNILLKEKKKEMNVVI